MMTCFYQASSLWQTVLLIISQLAVISLAAGAIVLFKRKCKLTKLIGTGAVFTLNAVLYIVMQLDSRLTGDAQISFFRTVEAPAGRKISLGIAN